MLRCLHIIILISILLACFSAGAQVSNLRKKKVAATGLISVDTLSMVPQSLWIAGADTSYYTIDYINSLL